MIPTVAAIIFRNNYNEVLLVEHKGEFGHVKGVLGLPSGQVTEKSEIQTLIQKLEKETTIKVNNEEIVPLPFEYEAEIKRSDGTTKHFGMKTYFINIEKANPKETTENMPHWIAIADLSDKNLLPNVKKAIKNALTYLKSE